MTGVLIKRGNLGTPTCTQGEHQVTGKAVIRSDAFISQVITKIVSKAQEARTVKLMLARSSTQPILLTV